MCLGDQPVRFQGLLVDCEGQSGEGRERETFSWKVFDESIIFSLEGLYLMNLLFIHKHEEDPVK